MSNWNNLLPPLSTLFGSRIPTTHGGVPGHDHTTSLPVDSYSKTSSYQSPLSMPAEQSEYERMQNSAAIDYKIASKEADKKRKRNAGASQRCRVRKQEEINRIETLEQHVKQLNNQLESLQQQILVLQAVEIIHHVKQESCIQAYGDKEYFRRCCKCQTINQDVIGNECQGRCDLHKLCLECVQLELEPSL